MSRELRQFAITVPTGTTKTSPHKAFLQMPPRVIRQVRVRVPPGPLGVVGFQLGNAGTQVLPANTGEWIVTDDETIPYSVDGYITSGTWWLIAYNTGTFTHTLQLAFTCTLTGKAIGAPTGLTFNVLSTSIPTATRTVTTTTAGSVPSAPATPGLPPPPAPTTPPAVTAPATVPVGTSPGTPGLTTTGPNLPPPPNV